MRSITAVDTTLLSSQIELVLSRAGWLVADSSALDWSRVVDGVPSANVLATQTTALQLQERAATELSEHGSSGVDLVRAQERAITAQADALALTQQLARQRAVDILDTLDTHGAVAEGVDSIEALAAEEARLIFSQMAREDARYARLTFRFPIMHRSTQTWGTVHFEHSTHHAVIRLRNANSERLKLATEALVKVVLDHGHAELGNVSFHRIKVLEANSSSEAFTGEVVVGRTLRSVLVERRRDLQVAGAFLVTGLVTFLLSSPLVLDVDFKAKTEVWINGWLGWFGGNLSRLGSSLFVAVFLPVIQVWLYWIDRRRQPVVNWGVGE